MDKYKLDIQILKNQNIIMEALHRLITPKCAGVGDVSRMNVKTNLALIDAISETADLIGELQ